MLTCKVAQEPERVTQQFSVNGHWLVRFPTKTVQRRSYFSLYLHFAQYVGGHYT